MLPGEMKPTPFLYSAMIGRQIDETAQKKWRRILSSTAASSLMINLFWYTWYRNWGKILEIEKKLFDNISIVYVPFFLTFQGHDKDLFFQVIIAN
jgi:hypothetical protein